jgi:hypothetical protein
MQIGHINLAKSFNGAGEHFVNLVEALQALDVRQHVLVRNIALARRLDLVEGVTVGPAVRSAVMAYCLMPPVDVAHVHNPSDGPSGLLLTLTRAIPFVLTHRDASQLRNPLSQAIYRRASGVVYQGDVDATRHLRIYEHAVENWRAAAPSA